MLLESDGSLLGNCGLAGIGEPNIWTSQAEVDSVDVSATPTAFSGMPSKAAGVGFNAENILCGPPQFKGRR